MEKAPFQFRLRTIFWATSIVATCAAGLTTVRNWHPLDDFPARLCWTLAVVGVGFLVYAARLKTDQDWRPGASQLLYVIAGMAFLVVSGVVALMMAFVAFAAHISG